MKYRILSLVFVSLMLSCELVLAANTRNEASFVPAGWFSTRQPLKIALGGSCNGLFEGEEQALKLLQKLAAKTETTTRARKRISDVQEKIEAHLPEIAGVVLDFMVKSPKTLPLEEALQEAFLILAEEAVAKKEYAQPFAVVVRKKIQARLEAMLREAEALESEPLYIGEESTSGEPEQLIQLSRKELTELLGESFEKVGLRPIENIIFVGIIVEERTFSDIGEQFNFSRERARQIFLEALRKVRKHVESAAEKQKVGKVVNVVRAPVLTPPPAPRAAPVQPEWVPFEDKFGPQQYYNALWVEGVIRDSYGRELIVKDPRISGHWRYPGKFVSTTGTPGDTMIQAIRDISGLNTSWLRMQTRPMDMVTSDGFVTIRRKYFLKALQTDLRPTWGAEAKWVTEAELQALKENGEWTGWWEMASKNRMYGKLQTNPKISYSLKFSPKNENEKMMIQVEVFNAEGKFLVTRKKDSGDELWYPRVAVQAGQFPEVAALNFLNEQVGLKLASLETTRPTTESSKEIFLGKTTINLAHSFRTSSDGLKEHPQYEFRWVTREEWLDQLGPRYQVY